YGRVASYLEYFGRRKTYSLYYHAFNKAGWTSGEPFQVNRARYLSVLDEDIRLVHEAGGRVFVEQLFDPRINDWAAPWTDYRTRFGWEHARKDIERLLMKYQRTRVFADVDDIWLVSAASYASSNYEGEQHAWDPFHRGAVSQ
ncbi:MAG: hypothetical protein C4293_12370, partial [Nitrospiraceae bacterium]